MAMSRLPALFGLLTLSLLLSLPVAAQTKLRITLQLPLKSHLGQNLLAFKSEVERESKGELLVEIYASAQLFKDQEVPQAVASGAVEMEVASLTRFAGTIPAVDVFYLPFVLSQEACRRNGRSEQFLRAGLQGRVQHGPGRLETDWPEQGASDLA